VHHVNRKLDAAPSCKNLEAVVSLVASLVWTAFGCNTAKDDA